MLHAVLLIPAVSLANSGSGLSPGDVLVGIELGGATREYTPSGSLVQSYLGYYLDVAAGSAVSPSGMLAMGLGSYLPPTVAIFNAAGTNTSNISLPNFTALDAIPNVTYFPDGTLAVAELNQSTIDEFNTSLNEIRTFSTSGSNSVGMTVDPWSDDLVVATRSGQVDYFTEAGSLVDSFNLGFSPGQLQISPLDDTMWVIDTNGVVHHLSSSGNPLGQFSTAFISDMIPQGLALAANDQSVYVSAQNYQNVLQYNFDGDEIGSLYVGPGQAIGLLSVVPVPEPVSALFVLGAVALANLRSVAGPRSNSCPSRAGRKT